jgi:hypothetical protein
LIGSKKSKKWQEGKGWGNIVKWFSYKRKQRKENKIMIQRELNFIGSRTIRLFVKHFFRRNFLFRSIFFCVSIQKKQKQKCTLRFLSQKNCTFFWKRLRIDRPPRESVIVWTWLSNKFELKPIVRIPLEWRSFVLHIKTVGRGPKTRSRRSSLSCWCWLTRLSFETDGTQTVVTYFSRFCFEDENRETFSRSYNKQWKFREDVNGLLWKLESDKYVKPTQHNKIDISSFAYNNFRGKGVRSLLKI